MKALATLTGSPKSPLVSGVTQMPCFYSDQVVTTYSFLVFTHIDVHCTIRRGIAPNRPCEASRPIDAGSVRNLTQHDKNLIFPTLASMRVPYIPDDPKMDSAEDQDTVERMKARRGGKLLELDKALLHSPPVANGWNSFFGAVRNQTTLPESIKELAMSRVAALNRAWYEWDHHAPLLKKTGVIEDSVVERLKDPAYTGDGLDEKHKAVLLYTDESTKTVIVPEKVFKEVKRLFSDREVVEITATIALYNCCSRFLVALDVGEMAEKYKVDMS